MRLFEILKLQGGKWRSVEFIKRRTIRDAEKELDEMKSHADANIVAWKITPYKEVEGESRTYKPRMHL